MFSTLTEEILALFVLRSRKCFCPIVIFVRVNYLHILSVISVVNYIFIVSVSVPRKIRKMTYEATNKHVYIIIYYNNILYYITTVIFIYLKLISPLWSHLHLEITSVSFLQILQPIHQSICHLQALESWQQKRRKVNNYRSLSIHFKSSQLFFGMGLYGFLYYSLSHLFASN